MATQRRGIITIRLRKRETFKEDLIFGMSLEVCCLISNKIRKVRIADNLNAKNEKQFSHYFSQDSN